MSSRQERLQTLGKRFSHSAPVETTQSKRSNNNRKRHSVYIDANLMQQVDETLKQVQHEIYPTEVTKSQFLEKLLERGLEDLSGIILALRPKVD